MLDEFFKTQMLNMLGEVTLGEDCLLYCELYICFKVGRVDQYDWIKNSLKIQNHYNFPRPNGLAKDANQNRDLWKQ